MQHSLPRGIPPQLSKLIDELLIGMTGSLRASLIEADGAGPRRREMP